MPLLSNVYILRTQINCAAHATKKQTNVCILTKIWSIDTQTINRVLVAYKRAQQTKPLAASPRHDNRVLLDLKCVHFEFEIFTRVCVLWYNKTGLECEQKAINILLNVCEPACAPVITLNHIEL